MKLNMLLAAFMSTTTSTANAMSEEFCRAMNQVKTSAKDSVSTCSYEYNWNGVFCVRTCKQQSEGPASAAPKEDFRRSESVSIGSAGPGSSNSETDLWLSKRPMEAGEFKLSTRPKGLGPTLELGSEPGNGNVSRPVVTDRPTQPSFLMWK
jgi:hypothetical protein